ncbi:GNAT family N-acetyltransferase [Microvirga pudoricolor]|uniref:GNAT family N-acetyltransferase n=1 Tax=Microvirga pudoricolor TaxID=2778729 RepID=UPI00194DC6B7|nr:GNAT family N-acetyltransferase [Microvirga pudoricolor]MBM6594582.1 GNAT family N-acetyltransferase [Microvirga pudoricolor]
MNHVCRPEVAISNLRDRPDLAPDVADRVWQAWWKAKGYPLDHIADLVGENLTGSSIPFSLVAHDRTDFIGTVSVIENDFPDRPDYTPWLAALWVDRDHRERGVGAALVEQAAQAAFALGTGTIYLGALPEPRRFYEKRGWVCIEENADGEGLSILRLDAARNSL